MYIKIYEAYLNTKLRKNFIPNYASLVSFSTSNFSSKIFFNVCMKYFHTLYLRVKIDNIDEKKNIYKSYVICRVIVFKWFYWLKTIPFGVFLKGVEIIVSEATGEHEWNNKRTYLKTSKGTC